MKASYILSGVMLLFSMQLYAQKSIRIMVRDDHGLPIKDVNMMQVGSSDVLGVSNEEGEAVLTFKRQDSVVFSKMGYARLAMHFSSFTSSSLQVTMFRTLKQLEEVTVSTGYQVIPKERATGSFTLVDQKTLNEQVGMNVVDRLPYVVGSMTNDQRSNSPSISIRGLSTIQGEKQPLIILDNFPYEGDLQALDPASVATITILKDAAAASIWGAKAGNGVIVITTKKSQFNRPVQITASARYNITDRPDLSKVHQISAIENLDLEKLLFEKDHYASNFRDMPTAVTPFVELLRKEQLADIDRETLEEYYKFYRNKDVRDAYKSHFYSAGTLQQYQITLAMGTQKLASRGAIGYDRSFSNTGAAMKRLNIDFSNKWQLTNAIALETGVRYTDLSTANGRPAFGSITAGGKALPSYFSFTDRDGSPLAISKSYDQSFLNGLYSGKLLDWTYIPLTDYTHVTNTLAQKQLLLDAKINIGIWKGLQTSIEYRYTKQPQENVVLNSVSSFYTRNLINLYSEINGNTVKQHIPNGAILNTEDQDFTGHNGRMQFNYNLTAGKHQVHALLGADMTNNERYGNKYMRYGYQPELLKYKEVNFLSPVKNSITGAMEFIPNEAGLRGVQNRYLSFFFNGAYTFNNRLSVTMSARKDGSNLFGVKTNDKFNPLGSVGTSYVLRKRDHSDNMWLNYLKLRTTYGISGNVDQTRSAVPIISYLSVNNYTQNIYARIESFANPNLRWEKIKMWNVGVDLSAFSDRLSLSVEYYRKDAYDLFGFAEVDYTTGVGTSMVKNVAAMTGNGMDIELKTVNVDKTVKWISFLNLSYYRDKITHYYQGSTYGYNYVGSESPNISGLVGKPIYGVYAYQWRGLDEQGNPVGVLGNQNSIDYNQITNTGTKIDDLDYHGPALPTFFGNFRNQISYKGFELSALMHFNLGFYYKKNALSYNSLVNNGQGHEEYSQRWQQAGDESWTTVPSFQYPLNAARDAFYRASSINVIKGDIIRLQYINLSYQLPSGLIKGINNINVGINAQNLGVLWRANKNKIDTALLDGALGSPKNYSVSLNMTF